MVLIKFYLTANCSSTNYICMLFYAKASEHILYLQMCIINKRAENHIIVICLFHCVIKLNAKAAALSALLHLPPSVDSILS